MTDYILEACKHLLLKVRIFRDKVLDMFNDIIQDCHPNLKFCAFKIKPGKSFFMESLFIFLAFLQNLGNKIVHGVHSNLV